MGSFGAFTPTPVGLASVEPVTLPNSLLVRSDCPAAVREIGPGPGGSCPCRIGWNR